MPLQEMLQVDLFAWSLGRWDGRGSSSSKCYRGYHWCHWCCFRYSFVVRVGVVDKHTDDCHSERATKFALGTVILPSDTVRCEDSPQSPHHSVTFQVVGDR